MLYSNENRDVLEKINELVSLQDQVKTLRLQDKQENQNFQEDMKTYLNQILILLNRLLRNDWSG